MFPRPPLHSRAFLLLEVLLSLGILGLAAAVLLRSYALGANSLVKSEAITVACMLAEGLMDEFEIFPPQSSRGSGDFGDNYPGYRWEVKVDRERMRYNHVSGAVNPKVMDELVTYTVTIVYQPQGAPKAFVPLRFAYHPSMVELFSASAKFENQLLPQRN